MSGVLPLRSNGQQTEFTFEDMVSMCGNAQFAWFREMNQGSFRNGNAVEQTLEPRGLSA